MKTNYFSKVENKYVFNVSLIFWHLFVAISTLVVVVGFAVFIWSIIPPVEKKVVKPSYPLKMQYPAPAQVSFAELTMDNTVPPPPAVAEGPVEVPATEVIVPTKDDTTGLNAYTKSLNKFKKTIPPTKYSWEGSGFWNYPEGEAMWKYYQYDKYREWIATEYSMEEKLNESYRSSNATTYADKSLLLEEYVRVLNPLPEPKRIEVLPILLYYLVDNVAQNVTVLSSLSKVTLKMNQEQTLSYIESLVRFSNNYKSNGAQMIDYVASIIDKFDISQRVGIIDGLMEYYRAYFGENFVNQKEATDLFLPMIPQIKKEDQTTLFAKYNSLYIDKNYSRDQEIVKIENEYNQAKLAIDAKYETEKGIALQKYYETKSTKQERLYQSLIGIAGGIVLIVMIGTFLVFFSIQRSVRKLEKRLAPDDKLDE